MELKKIINPASVPIHVRKKIQIEYKTLNELLNHLDLDAKRLDLYLLQGYNMDEAILKLLEELDSSKIEKLEASKNKKEE